MASSKRTTPEKTAVNSRTKAMIDRLRPLGLYRFDLSSLVRHELGAYGAVIEEALCDLNRLQREMMVTTAEGKGIERWERLLFGRGFPNLDLSHRRARVIAALGIKKNTKTKAQTTTLLRVYGASAEIKEIMHEERIVVRVNDYWGGEKDYETVKKQLDRLLPAHLEIMIDLGMMSWDLLEDKGLTMDEWESANQTWEEFEQMGSQR